jgi:hypothetical protein
VPEKNICFFIKEAETVGLNTDFLERINLEMLSCQRTSLLINPERTNLYKVIVELRQVTQWPIISVGF